MSLIDQKEFTTLTRFAKAIAHQQGADKLQLPHFLAAAWAAHARGALADHASLNAHIKAHEAAIGLSLKSCGINLKPDDIALPEAEIAVPIDETLKQAIANCNAEDVEDPRRALLFVNLLLAPGVQLEMQESTAYHEAGHAIVSLVLMPEVRIGTATIAPQGGAAGAVSFMVAPDGNMSQEDFLDRLCVSLAGQIAQIKRYGPGGADAGARSDYQQATLCAWAYIAELGLDEQFGPVSLTALKQEAGVTSGWLFDEAQRRLQSLLKEAQTKTRNLVETHWHNIDRVARLLIEKQTVSEDEIRAVVI